MTTVTAQPGATPSSGARDLIGRVVDAGSWSSWDAPLPPGDPADASYAAALARARARTGADEAIVTGEGTVAGRRVAVVASEFGFLGGSIGVVAADRLLRAVERAVAERLPLLAAPASGGTRMQEGTRAFVQMVPVAAALRAHRSAGLASCVYLRHPTTGGVLASWGSLGHVTAAEPGALVGFLGPRVQAALAPGAIADGVQRAEHLWRHGVVDAVVPPEELRGFVARVLDVLCPSAPGHPVPEPGPDDGADHGRAAAAPGVAWRAVERSRRAERPGARALLQVAADGVTFLRGTAESPHGSGILVALARIGGQRCLVVGHDRQAPGRGVVGPAALRTAREGIRLAAELGLPLVALVDTPGAELSRQAEEGGLSAELAGCLADFVTVGVPSVSVLLGQGAGAAALALLPADRVVAAQHAWLAPLPPEGASVLLHGTPARAAEAAAAQRVAAAQLHDAGLVDRTVAEHPDAAEEPDAFLRRVAAVVARELRGVARAGGGDAQVRVRRYLRSAG